MIMKEPKITGKGRIKNDILLICALFAVSAAALVYLFVFRSSGDTVRVTVDGELYGTYSLSQSISEDIRTGENASELNRMVISDGKAYMEHASCPDGICVSHRPIFRDGESIVCLPNKVVVTVITDGGTDAPDIVA